MFLYFRYRYGFEYFFQGPTMLYIITGIIDSIFYQQILHENWLPCIYERYPPINNDTNTRKPLDNTIDDK